MAEAKEEVKDQALAFAVASYRPGLEVAVAGLCDMYCPAGLSSLVTPVFLQSLVGLAVKNTAGWAGGLAGWRGRPDHASGEQARLPRKWSGRKTHTLGWWNFTAVKVAAGLQHVRNALSSSERQRGEAGGS